MLGVTNWFPEIDRLPQHFQRRQYVEDRLVALARSGELRVMPLFNHPPVVVELVGQVLFGHDYQGQRQIQGRSIPRELQSYQVWLEALDGKTPIRYKAGFKPDRMVYRRVGMGRSGVIHQVDDIVFPAGEDCARGPVALPDAWRVLNQAGENCAVANSSRLQASLWKYREIDPPVEDIDDEPIEEIETKPETPKKRRGRPRKAAPAEVSAG